MHHVHLKSVDRARSYEYYEQFLSAERIDLNGVTEALRTAPTLLLVDEATTPVRSTLPTAFQHMGWGSADPVAWYANAHANGVLPDTRGNTLFSTSEIPTVGMPGSGPATFMLLGLEPPDCFPVPDAISYMYVLGPDQERIEVWSGADGRVNHAHFTTADLAATASWFERFLGVPVARTAAFAGFFIDDILFFFEPIGEHASYQPTDDHVLNHVAFSVTDLSSWLQRARAQEIEVVSDPEVAHGFRSFFVRGPDGLLIELVQAAPLPELCLPPSR